MSTEGAKLSPLGRTLLERFEAAELTASPSPARLAKELGVKPQIVAGVVEHLVRAGAVVRLAGGLLVARSRLDQLAGELAATGWERFAVTDFKTRFALSSKWAIPVLEHLAATGHTRREGEAHRVLRGDAPPPRPATPDLAPGAPS